VKDFSTREGHISILDFVIENICKKLFGSNYIATARCLTGCMWQNTCHCLIKKAVVDIWQT